MSYSAITDSYTDMPEHIEHALAAVRSPDLARLGVDLADLELALRDLNDTLVEYADDDNEPGIVAVGSAESAVAGAWNTVEDSVRAVAAYYAGSWIDKNRGS